MPILFLAFVLFLLIWLQAQIYRRHWNKKLAVNIYFMKNEAYESDKLFLCEELTNAKILPLPFVAVKFQLSKYLVFLNETNSSVTDNFYQNDLFSIMMYQKITRKMEFICAKRGYYRIKNVDLLSSNIFVSEKLADHHDCEAELTVFPKAIPFEDLEILYNQIYGSVIVRSFTNVDPFEFKGIREYEPQDGFRSVNFKATAKAGKLMVNTNNATASQQINIILNVQHYSSWTETELYEEAIRLAASLSSKYINDGLSVGILSNARDIATGETVRISAGSGGGHLHNILQSLARIDLQWEVRPLVPVLEGIFSSEAVYVIISTYHEPDFMDAFDALYARGIESYLVIPAAPGMKVHVEGKNIIVWEADTIDPISQINQKSVS